MRTRFVLSVAATDLLSLAVSFGVASFLAFGTAFPWQAQPIWPLIGFVSASMIAMSFVTDKMAGPGVPRPTYGRMSMIGLGSLLLTTGLLVIFRDAYFSRPFLFSSLLIWLVPATMHRIVRRRRPWSERMIVITKEKKLADDLRLADHAVVVEVFEPGFEGDMDLPEPGIHIAVDLGAVLSERMAQFVSSCDLAGYTIRPFASIYEEHTGRVPLVHLAEGWEISAPLLRVARWLPGKRATDLILTVLVSPIWLTLGLLVALYLKAAERGNVIFRQVRVGLDGDQFTMYKFRTMEIDAEVDGPRFASEHDPRVIKGGAFLRKSRLDEIPQLWNVIKGDMALVGPRAEQVSFAKDFHASIPFYGHRHLVRPGITGWAQVNYGYADDQAETVEKLTYDLYYIKHMSPVLDLRILWKSIWIVVTGFGAR